MTALDRVNVSASLGVSNALIKGLMNKAIWQWYAEHQDEVVFEKKVFFFSIKLRIRDLRFLIERIAGPEGST